MKTRKILNIEEALGVIHTNAERKKNNAAEIKGILSSSVSEEVFDDLQEGKYINLENGIILLTPDGDKIARDVTRRHRLAERLLVDVIDISGNESDEAACEFEHILSSDVTDAICTLLGHPRVCPHGSVIPPGPCCEKAEEKIESIVTSLLSLDVSEKARIAYIVTSEHPYLHKLLSIGIVPGAEIQLHQKSPSYVIKSGETQIALDSDVASQIYVRRI